MISHLQRIGISPAVIREVLQALFGLKIIRTSICDSQLPHFVSVIEACGLYVGISKQKYFACPDAGKGGWCNAPPIVLEPESRIGEHYLYVGANPEKVMFAMQSEETGSELDFAESLGIPQCCSDFYLRDIDIARQVQNDLLPFSYQNTEKKYPFNFWVTITSEFSQLSIGKAYRQP